MARFIEAIRKYCPRRTGFLIAINCTIFIIVAVASLVSRFTGNDFDRQLLGWLSLPSSFDLFIVRAWTLLTYMFTQYSVLHLLFNMIWLWWFANVLQYSTLHDKIIRIYLAGGVSGGILYLLAYALFPALSISNAWLTGSSASVIAIMTIAAFHSPDHEFRLLLIGNVKLKWIAIISVILIFLGGSGNTGGCLAHAGGLLYGVAQGLHLRKTQNRKAPRRNAKKVKEAMQRYASDTHKLDELLDKIRISGFGSLTYRERAELDKLSKRLGRQQ